MERKAVSRWLLRGLRSCSRRAAGSAGPTGGARATAAGFGGRRRPTAVGAAVRELEVTFEKRRASAESSPDHASRRGGGEERGSRLLGSWGSGDSRPGSPASGCRHALGRRAGQVLRGRPGKTRSRRFPMCFSFYRELPETLGTRPGNGSCNRTGVPPQGLEGCSGLGCLQVIGFRTARWRSRQSTLNF